MSGVGSTNAMKKGSANNPFLAYSEADMQGYLKSAYTGCIVKYDGPSTMTAVPRGKGLNLGDAQNLVVDLTKSFTDNQGLSKSRKWYITIESETGNKCIMDITINKQTGVIGTPTLISDTIKALIYSVYTPYSSLIGNNINDLDVKFLSVTGTDVDRDVVTNWPVTSGWQKDCFNDSGKITLWGYSEKVTAIQNQNDMDYWSAYPILYTEPYVANVLYKVVYSNGQYYFEEFYHISENVTTATVEDVAPGKTFYDFTGTKQTGTGTKINPYLATDLDTFKSFPIGSFIKWLGPNKTVLDETTGQMLIQGEVYRAVEDGDILQYVILPTLSNPGTAADLAQGKQLIDGDGKVVDGTAPTQGDVIALYANRQLTEFITDAEIECIGFKTLNAFYSTTSGVLCFNYQSMLERVECPNLKNLYIYAFVGCDKLSYISIPYETDIHQYSNYGGTNYFPRNLYMSRNGVYGYDTNGDGKIEYITLIDTTNSSAALGAKVLMPFAFSSSTYITSINLPDVLTIAESAYSYNYSKSNNSYVKLISLPECRKIGSYAFRGLVSLSKVYCPNVEHLRYSAFAGCTMLSDITLDNLKTVGGYVFEGTDIHQNYFSKVISWYTGYGMASNISELYLPVATYVDESNRYLTSISIPNAVTVSLSLNNISSLDLPNAQYCTYLLSGSNIETISIPKLQYCRILYLPNCTNINAPCLTNGSTSTAYSSLTIYANNATSINISNFVDNVTICSCSKLEYLNAENARRVELSNNFILNSKIASSINKMNNFVVSASTSEDLSITIDNENLTYMYLSLSNISNYTTYCTVRINNASPDLSGFYVYGNAITKLTLGYSGFRSLRWNSVTVKARLSELYLTSNCTYLNSSMFSNIASLQTISVDKGVTIGSSCFSGCYNLSEVFVRNWTYIYNYAFSGCSKLSAFIIASPTSVNNISSSTFYNTPISNSTYLGYYGSIYVPSSYVQSYRRASGWSEYYYRITSITNLPQELKDKYGLNGVE